VGEAGLSRNTVSRRRTPKQGETEKEKACFFPPNAKIKEILAGFLREAGSESVKSFGRIQSTMEG